MSKVAMSFAWIIACQLAGAAIAGVVVWLGLSIWIAFGGGVAAVIGVIWDRPLRTRLRRRRFLRQRARRIDGARVVHLSWWRSARPWLEVALFTYLMTTFLGIVIGSKLDELAIPPIITTSSVVVAVVAITLVICALMFGPSARVPAT